MAEGEANHMSPRGAFFIGLALGLGLAFIIFSRQKTTYEHEIDKMKSDLQLTTKMVAEDHAELAKLKEAAETKSETKSESKPDPK